MAGWQPQYYFTWKFWVWKQKPSQLKWWLPMGLRFPKLLPDCCLRNPLCTWLQLQVQERDCLCCRFSEVCKVPTSSLRSTELPQFLSHLTTDRRRFGTSPQRLLLQEWPGGNSKSQIPLSAQRFRSILTRSRSLFPPSREDLPSRLQTLLENLPSRCPTRLHPGFSPIWGTFWSATVRNLLCMKSILREDWCRFCKYGRKLCSCRKLQVGESRIRLCKVDTFREKSTWGSWARMQYTKCRWGRTRFCKRRIVECSRQHIEHSLLQWRRSTWESMYPAKHWRQTSWLLSSQMKQPTPHAGLQEPVLKR